MQYRYKAYMTSVDGQIRLLVRESVGIRGITRILCISKGTVLTRIKELAARIKKPIDASSKASFEVDELWTYLNRKENEYWVVYAIDRRARSAVDFVVGKRIKATLKQLIDSLLITQKEIGVPQ